MDLYQKEENFKQSIGELTVGKWSKESTEDQQHGADQKTWNAEWGWEQWGRRMLVSSYNQV